MLCIGTKAAFFPTIIPSKLKEAASHNERLLLPTEPTGLINLRQEKSGLATQAVTRVIEKLNLHYANAINIQNTKRLRCDLGVNFIPECKKCRAGWRTQFT